MLQLVSGKIALKYSGSDIDAMKAISQAAKKRSLADFQKVKRDSFPMNNEETDDAFELSCRPSRLTTLSWKTTR